MFFGRHVAACSCIDKEDVKRARQKADAVILGTVVSVEQLRAHYPSVFTSNPIYVNRYTLKVERSFKGRPMPDTVVVISWMGSGNCGYPFEVNESYLVYGYRDGGNTGRPYGKRVYAEKPLAGRWVFWTDICTRTTRDHVKEIEALDGLK
ncbi:MAG: hypothetical protein WEC15_07550 [Flavobacteriales bacterium]